MKNYTFYLDENIENIIKQIQQFYLDKGVKLSKNQIVDYCLKFYLKQMEQSNLFDK